MKADLSFICPHCKQGQDSVTPAVGGKQKPRVGDRSMCIRCGEFAVFDANLLLREPTVDEYIEMGQDASLANMRKAWVMMQDVLTQGVSEPHGGGESMLDIAFANIEKGVAGLGNAPPQSIHIMKAIFALGAKSVFDLIEAAADGEECGELMERYSTDVQDFMLARAQEMAKRLRRKQ